MDTLKAHFRPEFLNRVDETIMFHSLGEEQIRGIVKVQIKLVAERLKAKKITLDVSEKAYQFLAEKGFDPLYGARPLKRVIQTHLLNPLSNDIIAGKIKPGDTVNVNVDRQVLTLS